MPKKSQPKGEALLPMPMHSCADYEIGGMFWQFHLAGEGGGDVGGLRAQRFIDGVVDRELVLQHFGRTALLAKRSVGINSNQ